MLVIQISANIQKDFLKFVRWNGKFDFRKRKIRTTAISEVFKIGEVRLLAS